MNNYYKRIMARVPNSELLIKSLSLSEKIPSYPKEKVNMFLKYEYNTFIGLIYETALKSNEKYWNGEALTNCFIRNIKEFIEIFKCVKEESFDKIEFLYEKPLNNLKIKKNKIFGERYCYPIGIKTDGNKTMTLYYIQGDDELSARFRLEAKEQIGIVEYPYFKMNVDFYEDGRIEFSKRLLVNKRPSGKLISVAFPDNYKYQPAINFNHDGVVAVRDIFAYVFEQIKDNDEVKTSHR